MKEECVHLTNILYPQAFLPRCNRLRYVFSRSNTAKYGKMLLKAPLKEVI